MILLTGAAGKTGKAILNRLVLHGVRVRSLVRTARQAEEIKRMGSSEVIIGDLRDQESLTRALDGIGKLYFICPNMTPDELEIGKTLIRLTREHSVSRFVYHSVLHPQIEAMPHHWQKMRVEEKLFESGLNFTILQPCAYMQNILANWKSIEEDGSYAVPYATSTRISMVDLEDIAAAAEVVLTQLNHSNAIYELAGPQALSQLEVAEVLSAELGKPVHSVAIDRAVWEKNARLSGLDERSIETLLLMFEYYENFNLAGNTNILSYLIKKPATTFSEFVHRINTTDQRNRVNGKYSEKKE